MPPLRETSKAAAVADGAADLQGLSDGWLGWVAENLLGGADISDILLELERQGVPEDVARKTLAAIQISPVFQAALGHARHARRLELLRRLLLAQRTFESGEEVIVRQPIEPVSEFFGRYVAASTPVIFTDLVTRWPGFAAWSPESLALRFGEVMLDVAWGRDSTPNYDMLTQGLTRKMSLQALVAAMRAAESSNNFYAVAQNKNLTQPALQPMFEEMWFPEGWLDSEHFVGGSALWLGPKGTITPLHHDTSNILFCQVYGRKQVILVSPLEVELCEGATSMYANLDPESAEGQQRLRGKLVKRAVLAPGEALFIPAGWWHHVRALDVSISIAVNNFSRPNNFDWYRPGEIR